MISSSMTGETGCWRILLSLDNFGLFLDSRRLLIGGSDLFWRLGAFWKLLDLYFRFRVFISGIGMSTLRISRFPSFAITRSLTFGFVSGSFISSSICVSLKWLSNHEGEEDGMTSGVWVGAFAAAICKSLSVIREDWATGSEWSGRLERSVSLR